MAGSLATATAPVQAQDYNARDTTVGGALGTYSNSSRGAAFGGYDSDQNPWSSHYNSPLNAQSSSTFSGYVDSDSPSSHFPGYNSASSPSSFNWNDTSSTTNSVYNF
jgi:hypothetical protein